MEFTEEELDNVIVGLPTREISEDYALKNENFFRKEQIEKLKQQREELKKMDEELTIEQLDQITAGIPRR